MGYRDNIHKSYFGGSDGVLLSKKWWDNKDSTQDAFLKDSKK